MKNFTLLFTITWLALMPTSIMAQVFWTEDFGTGCNQGQLADNFSTTNGIWSVTVTGNEANYPNTWYISAPEAGMGENNCGSGCLTFSNLINRTLHVGNVFIPIVNVPADQGAAYFSSQSICTNFALCGTTDKRVESPTIDCSGESNITLRYLYMENGGATSHNATIWYSADNGNNWAQIYDPVKTALTCTPQGIWTLDSIALPASADNNPIVKIGFRWVNDDDDNATDPSFAIDDIELLTPNNASPTADFISSDTLICENDCIDFTDLSTNSPTAWFWTFTGGNPGTSTVQNPAAICYAAAGNYDVTLVATNGNGSDTMTWQTYIEVVVCTGQEEKNAPALLSVVPNPMTHETHIQIDLAGRTNAKLRVRNHLGQLVTASYEITQNGVVLFKSGLSEGIYFAEIIHKTEIIGKARIVIQ